MKAKHLNILLPGVFALGLGVQAAHAEDELNLQGTFKGNREQPRVLYIVPWQQPGGPEGLDRPVNGLIDNVLTPIDRDVFQRELKYFKVLSKGEQDSAGGILSK